MSVESAKKLLDDMTSGTIQVNEQKLTGVDPSVAKAYIQSLGYDFTKEEMMEAMSDHGISMSIEEAELIAGGRHPATEMGETLVGVAVGSLVLKIAAMSL